MDSFTWHLKLLLCQEDMLFFIPVLTKRRFHCNKKRIMILLKIIYGEYDKIKKFNIVSMQKD